MTVEGEAVPPLGPPTTVAFGGVRVTYTSASLQAHRHTKIILAVLCQILEDNSASGYADHR